MNRTKIEYGTHAWNPVTGCSYGCPWGCWAEGIVSRFPQAHSNIHMDGEPWPFAWPVCHPERLDEPMRLKKPARILVSFMGDLFGPEVPDEFKGDVFNEMFTAEQHQFFLLTKRVEEMQGFIENSLDCTELKNTFLGVTVTTQAEADERIPLLMATPAARRWISVEPMLGQIVLRDDWITHCSEGKHGGYCEDASKNRGGVCYISDTPCPLSFVVVGSIDRPTAQYPAPRRKWIESIREQCRAAGVPLWEKNNLARHGVVKDRPLVQELPV